jgi:hypothetical protein
MHAPAIAELDLSGKAVEVDLVVRGEGRKSNRKKSAQRLTGGGSAQAGFRKRQGGCPQAHHAQEIPPAGSFNAIRHMFILTPSHLIGDSPGRNADEAAEA